MRLSPSTLDSRLSTLSFFIAVVCLLPSSARAAEEASHGLEMGKNLPLWTLIPFVALLVAIAVLPLAAGHWWERNRNKGIIAAVLAVPLALYLVGVWGDQGVHALEEKALEYVSFILLLGALFVISGGIYVQGSLSGTPLVNTALLGLGALLASFVGTTGASVLLIRPLLRANVSRQRQAHVVVFFIFVVSNCGGLLTPLGDPPLFLGFMKGVPFDWTFRLWKEWALINGLLLLVFNTWDQIVLAAEEKYRPGSQLEQLLTHEPFRVQGMYNLLFLAGIVATIYAAGEGLGNSGQTWPWELQVLLVFALAIGSYLATPGAIRASNRFTFGPIIEVAVLFAGIFVTMVPALLILNANGPKLGIEQPWQYFWATGILSSFLDNAPTYLTFAATACGAEGIPLEGKYLAVFFAHAPTERAEQIIAAISCGAVFMGANTYIGNGPNFMVKAIAEESGVRMPTFFGYMLYSSAILLPIFVVVTLVFFR